MTQKLKIRPVPRALPCPGTGSDQATCECKVCTYQRRLASIRFYEKELKKDGFKGLSSMAKLLILHGDKQTYKDERKYTITTTLELTFEYNGPDVMPDVGLWISDDAIGTLLSQSCGHDKSIYPALCSVVKEILDDIDYSLVDDHNILVDEQMKEVLQ